MQSSAVAIDHRLNEHVVLWVVYALLFWTGPDLFDRCECTTISRAATFMLFRAARNHDRGGAINCYEVTKLRAFIFLAPCHGFLVLEDLNQTLDNTSR